jgi:hypothetical protein
MNKIDIIIDVLEIAANEVESAYVASHIDEALIAARELKALKPVAWMYKGNFHDFDPSEWASPEFVVTPLYTAPPRKEWVGLTNEDWENTPDTGKQGCERDAELFDWVEQKLKEKNDFI